MKLRMITLHDEGLHKIIIVDDNRSRARGKMVACVMATTFAEAMDEAKDVHSAILRNGNALIWN